MRLPGSLSSPIFMSLGNPGEKYLLTRHSVGHLFLQSLRAQFTSSSIGLVSDLGTHSLVLNKHYMNLSGVVVRSGLFKDKRLILIVDDLDLGWAKVKHTVGGDRGHKGVKSIRNALGVPATEKILIGIGRPKSKEPEVVSEYVLGQWTRQERQELEEQVFPTVQKIMQELINSPNPSS